MVWPFDNSKSKSDKRISVERRWCSDRRVIESKPEQDLRTGEERRRAEDRRNPDR